MTNLADFRCYLLCELKKLKNEIEELKKPFRQYAFDYVSVNFNLHPAPPVPLNFPSVTSPPWLANGSNSAKIIDETNGAFNPSTGEFTVPEAGIWRFDTSVQMNSTDLGSRCLYNTQIVIDGVVQDGIGYTSVAGSHGDSVGSSGLQDPIDASSIFIMKRLSPGAVVKIQVVFNFSNFLQVTFKYTFSGIRLGA